MNVVFRNILWTGLLAASLSACQEGKEVVALENLSQYV